MVTSATSGRIFPGDARPAARGLREETDFADVSDRAGAPWHVPRVARGLAAGDLDNDGRVDLLIVSQNRPLAYFHNRTAGATA